MPFPHPVASARYTILSSTLQELMRCHIIQPSVRLPTSLDLLANPALSTDRSLRRIVEQSEGFSGRLLRKLPLQTHALLACQAQSATLSAFLEVGGYFAAALGACLA